VTGTKNMMHDMQGFLKQSPLQRGLGKLHRAAFHALYNDFPAAYNAFVKTFGYCAPEVVVTALLPFLEEGRQLKILDAGCGTGLTGKALCQHRDNLTIHGFDCARDMIKRAEKTGLYERLIVADATKPLPVEPQSYDGAMASGLYTLGHVGPEALLPVINAIKPGGFFALNIFEPAWIRLDFESHLDDLVASNRIAIVHHAKDNHWKRLLENKTHVLVLEIMG
jgi:predicted TPR repeat methyltransferase